MMDEDLKKRIDAQDQMIGKIYISVEKTRKYFLWTMIGTIAMFVLPLFGLMFAIPKFISIINQSYSSINSLGL